MKLFFDEATSIIEFTDLLKNFRFKIWIIEILLRSVSIHNVADYGPPRHFILVILIAVSILPVPIPHHRLKVNVSICTSCFPGVLFVSNYPSAFSHYGPRFYIQVALVFLKTSSWLMFCPHYSQHIFIESYLPCLQWK